MGDCRNCNETIDPLLWAYWTSTGICFLKIDFILERKFELGECLNFKKKCLDSSVDGGNLNEADNWQRWLNWSASHLSRGLFFSSTKLILERLPFFSGARKILHLNQTVVYH